MGIDPLPLTAKQGYLLVSLPPLSTVSCLSALNTAGLWTAWHTLELSFAALLAFVAATPLGAGPSPVPIAGATRRRDEGGSKGSTMQAFPCVVLGGGGPKAGS